MKNIILNLIFTILPIFVTAQQNQDSGLIVATQQVEELLEQYQKPMINISKPPKVDLKNYCGDYSKDGFGTFIVFMKEENLYVKFPLSTFRLVHDKNNGFTSDFAEERPTEMPAFLYFDFNVSNDNDVTGVITNLSENGVKFNRKGF